MIDAAPTIAPGAGALSSLYIHVPVGIAPLELSCRPVVSASLQRACCNEEKSRPVDPGHG